MHVRRSRIFWGILILCLSGAVIANLAGLFEWNELSWGLCWPIIPAVLSLAALVSGSLSVWNFGVLLVSAWLLLCNFQLIPVENGNELAFAIGFGILGIWLIVTAFFPHTKKQKPFNGNPVHVCGAGRQSTVFDDVHFVCCDQPFTFGQYSTVFGDVSLDMRTATIADGAVLEISCVFGDIDIMIPSGCRIRLDGSRVFGEVKQLAPTPADETLPLLIIRHSVVFGDITVR
jgi:predicted membrane protein